MKLLVAEKPSVARAYKELLEKVEGERFTQRDGYFEGKEFNVSWCVGHLVGLADPEKYGWSEWKLEALPMIPIEWKFETLPDTRKQFQVVAELMRKADVIINGADAGREGELIFGLVVIAAGLTGKNLERLWLNSMVFDDMVKAWKKRAPAQQYARLLESAICRSKADWLLGMNASRGYSLGTGVRGLSVGRVQTPTLALIVKRDLEIENWQDRFYFQLAGIWRALRFLFVREKDKEFAVDTDLQKVKTDCEGQIADLVEFDKEERKINPGKPFDLSELQKAANRVYGLKAAVTLELTQSLYEKKFVTYPRTDSQYLPDGMKEEAWAIVNKVAGAGEREVLRNPSEHFAFFDSSKVSDHFAIIPTGSMEGLDHLEESERKVYSLIRTRFVLAFGRPYRFEEYKLGLNCNGHTFKARATRELDAGFKKAQRGEEPDSEGGEEGVNKLSQALNWKVGDKDRLTNLEVARKKAAKPVHYTEAALLTAMETAGKVITDEAIREAMKERGLGTPATKAAIIETLKRRDYVVSQGKYIISASKGRELVALVDGKIASPEMTGEWEYKLNQMARGSYDRVTFMKEITDYVRGITPSYSSKAAQDFEEKIMADNAPCPKCKKAKLRENSAGLFCMDKEGCGFKLWAKVADKKLTAKNIRDLLEKGKTGLVKGFTSKKTGKKFDAVLKLEDWAVKFDFQNG